MPQTNDASQTVPPRLRFLVAPKASHLLRARDRVRDYLTLLCHDQAPVDDMVLAVEEACTNAIRHSGSRRDIEIRLSFEGDDLLAAVKDHGSGFDVGAFVAQTPPDPLADHGRGLFLISRLCDEMELRRNGGLEVRLVKRGVARHEPAALESGLGDIDGAPQRALREARMRSLLDEIDEAFMAFDWEYRFAHANEASVRLLGKTRDELIGRRAGDIWPHRAATPVASAVREAMQLGRSSVTEFRDPESGDWLEARVYPTPAGVSLYAREINQRKRVEAESDLLLSANARLRRDVDIQAEALKAQAEALEAQDAVLHAQTEDLRVWAGDLAERRRLAAALDAVDGLLRSILSFDESMQRALDEGVRALAVDAGTIELRAQSCWVVRYQYGLADSDVGLLLTEAEAPFATRVARHKEPFAVADTSDEPALDVSLTHRAELRSVLAVPLLANEGASGCLLLYGAEPRTFTETEIDFARKLGAAVSLAIENARLLKAVTASKRQTREDRSYLTRLLDGLPYPVFFADENLVCRECNAAAAALVGSTAQRVVGRSVASIMGADNEATALIRRVLEAGESYSGTLTLVLPGLSGPAQYRVSCVADKDELGRVRGVLTTMVERA